MDKSAFTGTTRDIAEHLANKINGGGGFPDWDDLVHLIERELDKYFDEGTLQWKQESQR